jgi:CBS domain containing-hemolysin-like protein
MRDYAQRKVNMITIVYVASVLLLVLANGFFVASEFSLVGVRRSRIDTLAAQGNRRARRLVKLLDNLNAYISATQLGITMASLALGWIGEPVFAHLLERPLKGRVSDLTLHTISFTVAFLVITFLHIVLGELAPKTLALERVEKVALVISWPMEIFYRIFYWPIRMLDWAGQRTVRIFGLHATGEHGSTYTAAELRLLVDLSQQSGHLRDDQRQLLHRAFEFADVGVRDAMVSRTQVISLPIEATLKAARSTFLKTGYSRLPVYSDRSDNLVGVVYRKDLDMAQVDPGMFHLQSTMRSPAFIPESASAAKALRQMQNTKIHFLFVVNEHGDIEGILTLEDLLEEIVGEISDEYDREVREQIVPDGAGYLLDGMLAIRDANHNLELDLPEDQGYMTLAGFLMARAGRIPREGDVIEIEEGVFTIEQLERRRIRRVRFARRTAAPPSHVNAAALLATSAISFLAGHV